MIDSRVARSRSQISVMRYGEQSLLYCCHSGACNDMAGNPHVLSVGMDLVPALRSHRVPTQAVVASISANACTTTAKPRIPWPPSQVIRPSRAC